jgi:importin-5
MGRHLVDYIDMILDKTMPLVIFRYSEDVRNSASFALARLLKAAVAATADGTRPLAYAQGFLVPFTDTLIKGINGEVQPDARNSMAEALRDVLQVCAESGGKEGASGKFKRSTVLLRGHEASEVLGLVLQAASKGIERRTAITMAFQQDQETDENDEDRLAEELADEEELMTNLVDCVGYMLKSLREESVALFDSAVGPMFAPYMAANQPATLRHNAICLFDDMIEFGGPGAQKYLGNFLPVLLRDLGGEEAWLRQACAYGIIQVALTSPESLRPMVGQAVPTLLGLVQSPDARDDENVLCTENCVSALGTIATHVLADAEQAQLLALWLGQLPLKEDEIEARVVHRQLCDLIEQGHPAIVGNEFDKLPAVLSIFAQIFEAGNETGAETDESLVDRPTSERMCAILRQVQEQMPAQSVQAAWGSLSEQQMAAVQKTMQRGF